MSDFQNYYQEDSRDPYKVLTKSFEKKYTQKDSGSVFDEVEKSIDANKETNIPLESIILTGDPYVQKGVKLEEYKPYFGETIVIGKDSEKRLAEAKRREMVDVVTKVTIGVVFLSILLYAFYYFKKNRTKY